MSYHSDMEVTLQIQARDDREQLEELDERIEQWIVLLQDLVRELQPEMDREQFNLFVKTARSLAVRLDDTLPPTLGTAAVAEIRGIIIGAQRAVEDMLEEADEPRPLDVVDDFFVRAESIRHIVRDALDESLPCDPEDAGAIMRLLDEWLPRVTRKELAVLLDRDVKTLQRWSADGGKATRRLQLVASLVLLLKDSWTPEGVMAWFNRPRADLGDRAPVDLLDVPEYEKDLLRVARHGRAQHAS